MLAARTGLSPVMVGRAAELARLRELATATGDPAVALVSGEAGIGKTRLVAELVAILDPAMPVLAGQGSQAFCLQESISCSWGASWQSKGRNER
jgi:MoxR-like ATPase